MSSFARFRCRDRGTGKIECSPEAVLAQFVRVTVMIRILVVKAMTVDPVDRADIDAEKIVGDGHRLDKPRFEVERAVRDAQMEHVGKIDACKEPEDDQIDAADCQSTQRSDFFWSKKCASYSVERKDEITNDVVYFHSGAPECSCRPVPGNLQALAAFDKWWPDADTIWAVPKLSRGGALPSNGPPCSAIEQRGEACDTVLRFSAPHHQCGRLDLKCCRQAPGTSPSTSRALGDPVQAVRLLFFDRALSGPRSASDVGPYRRDPSRRRAGI